MAAQEYLIPGKGIIINETESGKQYLIPGLGIILDERVPAVGGVTSILPGFKNTNIFRHMIGR